MLEFEFLKNMELQMGYDVILRHPTDNFVICAIHSVTSTEKI
jgi:hypothetical protein